MNQVKAGCNFWRGTLRGRLAAAFGLIAILGVVLTGFSTWWQLERDLGMEMEATLMAIAETTARNIDPIKLSRLNEMRDPYYEELREKLHLVTIKFNLAWLGVYRFNGEHYTHLADGEDRGNGFCLDYPVYDDTPQLLAAWKGTPGIAPVYEDAFGRWQSAFCPVRDADGTVVGVVDASRDLNLLQLWRHEIILRTIGIGAGITLLTLALCFFFATKISKPVARLSEAAGEIASGSLDIHVFEQSPFKEVQTLIDAFDTMACSLNRSQTDLKQRLGELTVLFDVAQQLNFAASTEEVLRVILQKTIDMLGLSGGRIYLFQEDTKLLATVTLIGEAPGEEHLSPVSDPGPIGSSYNNKVPVFTETTGAEPADSTGHPGGILCFPLLIADQALGVMVLPGRDQLLSANDHALARTLAAQAALTIEKSRLYELSVHDGLTQLFVHRYFQHALDNEIRRSLRYESPCSLVLIDVDHFKAFNDTWGHQIGDLVLKTVAQSIRETVRTVDIPARYGGEEFAVILPETPLDAAILVAERIRLRIEQREVPGRDQVLKVTVSLGIATFPIHAEEKSGLIRLADQALYAAKEAGRNRVMHA